MDLPQVIFAARVVDSKMLSAGVKRITFQTKENFSFKPGQYAWVELKELQFSDPHGARRAFSLLNLPNPENKIDILVRSGDGGYKQSLFALDKDDEVRIHGPFGSAFVLENDFPQNIVLVAGGVGIAPFLSILQDIKNRKLPVKCFLVFSSSKENKAFLEKLLSDYKVKNVMSKTVFKQGHLVWGDFEPLLTSLVGDSKWWLSGPQDMVDATSSILKESGVSTADMVFENFYPHHANSLTREMVEAQLKTDNLFSAALQNSTNHTIITDVNGITLFANKAAEKITGYSSGEIIGNTPRLWGGLMGAEFYRQLWKKKISGEAFEGEVVNRRKNGEIYHTIAHIAPIVDSKHQVIGFIGTEEDVTEMKKQEAKLADSQFRLSFALEGSRDGLWDWEITSGKVDFSPRFKEMLGYADGDLEGNIDEWKKRVHPEDWPMVEVEVEKMLSGSNRFYETRHRILCKDGTYKWILDRGMVVLRDSRSNKALRAIGTHTDITEIKNRELELERLNKIMVGREIRMIELKKEIERLSKIKQDE